MGDQKNQRTLEQGPVIQTWLSLRMGYLETAMIATNWDTWKRNGQRSLIEELRQVREEKSKAEDKAEEVGTIAKVQHLGYSINVLLESTGDHRVKEDDCNQRMPNSQLCNYLAWRQSCYWLVWKLKSQDCEENASAIDADREEAVLILRWPCESTRLWWLWWLDFFGKANRQLQEALPYLHEARNNWHGINQ